MCDSFSKISLEIEKDTINPIATEEAALDTFAQNKDNKNNYVFFFNLNCLEIL